MGPREQQNTVDGALMGGILGGIIGNNIGDGNNQALGAALGAVLGGAAGGDYGRSQDQIHNRLAGVEQRLKTETVLIDNDNGSITEVPLQKLPDGRFLGPKGEIYSSKPAEKQLKPIYGLK